MLAGLIIAAHLSSREIAASPAAYHAGQILARQKPCEPERSAEMWECTNWRIGMLGGLVQRQGFQVVSWLHSHPYEVIEPREHKRGTVQYDASRVVQLHEESGFVEIPLLAGRVPYWLVWRIAGEFTYYQGPRLTPLR